MTPRRDTQEGRVLFAPEPVSLRSSLPLHFLSSCHSLCSLSLSLALLLHIPFLILSPFQTLSLPFSSFPGSFSNLHLPGSPGALPLSSPHFFPLPLTLQHICFQSGPWRRLFETKTYPRPPTPQEPSTKIPEGAFPSPIL